MLTWSDEYRTGIRRVDVQHRALFQVVNRLEILAASDPIDVAELEQLVNFTEDYITYHFGYEEQCMQSRRCPAHAANKEAHERFIVQWHEFKRRYTEHGAQKELIKEVLSFAEDWIRSHILRVDICLREPPAQG